MMGMAYERNNSRTEHVPTDHWTSQRRVSVGENGSRDRWLVKLGLVHGFLSFFIILFLMHCLVEVTCLGLVPESSLTSDLQWHGGLYVAILSRGASLSQAKALYHTWNGLAIARDIYVDTTHARPSSSLNANYSMVYMYGLQQEGWRENLASTLLEVYGRFEEHEADWVLVMADDVYIKAPHIALLLSTLDPSQHIILGNTSLYDGAINTICLVMSRKAMEELCQPRFWVPSVGKQQCLDPEFDAGLLNQEFLGFTQPMSQAGDDQMLLAQDVMNSLLEHTLVLYPILHRFVVEQLHLSILRELIHDMGKQEQKTAHEANRIMKSTGRSRYPGLMQAEKPCDIRMGQIVGSHIGHIQSSSLSGQPNLLASLLQVLQSVLYYDLSQTDNIFPTGTHIVDIYSNEVNVTHNLMQYLVDFQHRDLETELVCLSRTRLDVNMASLHLQDNFKLYTLDHNVIFIIPVWKGADKKDILDFVRSFDGLNLKTQVSLIVFVDMGVRPLKSDVLWSVIGSTVTELGIPAYVHSSCKSCRSAPQMMRSVKSVITGRYQQHTGLLVVMDPQLCFSDVFLHRCMALSSSNKQYSFSSQETILSGNKTVKIWSSAHPVYCRSLATVDEDEMFTTVEPVRHHYLTMQLVDPDLRVCR